MKLHRITSAVSAGIAYRTMEMAPTMERRSNLSPNDIQPRPEEVWTVSWGPPINCLLTTSSPSNVLNLHDNKPG
ncbi:hypothetical protein M8J75_009201 [Diaphorina citri]|nr:hypothetical protein M8J75_009201 [Diaphorina citri]